VQQDLGNVLLFDYIADGRKTGVFSAREKEMLRKTVRRLAQFQVVGAKNFDFKQCYPQPEFNLRSILWDLNYFKYCFLKATGLDFQEDKFHKLVFDAEVLLRYRNLGDNTLLYHAFDNIVGDNTRHVIFVHTFGSTPPDVYLQYLKEKGITVTLVATKPYLFEGTIKRERVEQQLIQSKKHTDHLVVIDAEDVRKAHTEMTPFDAYPLLDKVIGDKIESILSKE
jgi:hypothetical protein